MITTGTRSLSIMVCFAIVLHIAWAGIILFDHAAIDSTAVHALYRYIPSVPLLIMALLTAAGLAIVGLFTRVPWIVLFLLPQQFLLLMCAAGAIEAMWIAQFADGVVRSRGFIMADQFYSVLAAIGHTIAIIAHARRIA